MPSTLIGVREAAIRLGVHENTIRNWEERGLIRSVRLPVSGYRRFDAGEVARFADEMRAVFALADEGPTVARRTPSSARIVHGDIE